MSGWSLIGRGTLALGLCAALLPGQTAATGQAPLNGCGTATVSSSAPISIQSNGVTRTAIVHVPTAPAGARLPVLFALHGAAQDGAFFERYTGYSTIADAARFIAVYPNALPEASFRNRPFWNIDDHDPSQPDDVRFISDLLTWLHLHHCVDGQRVFATGVSNGGGMAARLGCQLANRIDAIAPVAGGYKALPPCHPAMPISVLEVHGTADSTVPYNGLPPNHAGAVMPYVRAWAKLDRCQPSPSVRTPAPRVVSLSYLGCADRTEVEHLRIVGGGHQLPGALPPDAGQAASIDVPIAVWRFFAAHGRIANASAIAHARP